MTSHKILGCIVAALLVFITLVPGESAVVSPLSFERPQASQSISPSAISQEEVATKAHLERSFGQLPLYFVENQGQMDEQVAYYIQGSDKTIYFTSEGVTFALTAPLSQTVANPAAQMASLHLMALRSEREMSPEPQRWVVKLDFVGANSNVQPTGEERTEAVVSYFKGPQDQWHAGLPTYSRIVYRDLWPGIDLVYYGTVNALKYEFVVHPGADPSQIRLAYRGAESVTLNAAGQLEVSTPAGGFSDDTPIAYQDIDGQRVPVSAAYALKDAAGDSPASQQFYTFALGPYDPAHLLILDPVVLVYCGYVGGNDQDGALGIAVDDVGNSYIVGSTFSTETSFPVTVGPDLTYNGGYYDAFVAKVNAAGSGLVYAGYIGGSGHDEGADIAVDGNGNAYVTGVASSTEASFPITVGPDLTHNGGEFDVFVAKVNATGSGLVYAGYVGGNDLDLGRGIAVDSAGSAYVVGWTRSGDSFPVVVGPDLTYNGGNDYGDAFVAKVNTAGTNLVYAGYIGGNGDDYGESIAVDSVGCAYVTGYTQSSESSFPVTGGPDLTYNGGSFYGDAYVVKINAAGTSLIYAGYIGGSGEDSGRDIAVDNVGNAYIAGTTNSAESSFPVNNGPDLTYNNMTDAFVAKVNVTGLSLVYAGYIGGNSSDEAFGIAVDNVGNAYVTGYTKSNEASFPVAVGPDLAYNGGGADAFVAKVNVAGSGLIYASYIGGSGTEYGTNVIVDDVGNAYITGWTTSSEASFPVTGGPDLTLNGVKNAFVAKVTTVHFSISGQVTDAGDNPIADVLVLAGEGLNATTDASGYYTLTTILSGTYTLTPTLSGASFWPVTRTVTITSTDVSGQDFTGAIAPTSVTIDGPLTGTVGTVYTFTATVTPVTTTLPITYTWMPEPVSGQGTPTVTYSWVSPGTQTITVTVTNAGGVVMAPHAIEVNQVYSISGRAVDEGGNSIANVLVLTDEDLNTATDASGYYTLTGILSGTYTLTPTLNGASFWPVTRTVTITSTDVSGQDFTGTIAPTSVAIDGPLTGTVGTVYTFTAVVTPVTTTMPITYTWTPEPASGQGTPTATYSWTLPGTQTITVTVTNAGGEVMAPHNIEVKRLLFLPLVMHNY